MKPAPFLRISRPADSARRAASSAVKFRIPGSASGIDVASKGFTLIEITIAITIASLALVGLLGMLPQGIRTMKMATDMAIETRIHQQIISELTQSDWDDRYNYNNAVRFFDDQGIVVTQSQNNTDEGLYPIVYSVRILVPKTGEPLPSALTKPGGQRPTFQAFDNTAVVKVSGSVTNTDFDGVQLVLLEICTSGLARTANDFESTDYQRSIHVYRSTLVRTMKL